MHHRIQPFSCRHSENIRITLRNIFYPQDSSTDRIINIVIDIRNFIRQSHDLSFQRMRISTSLMIFNPINYFPGQIQSLSLFFQIFYYTHTLYIMTESRWTDTGKRTFPCVSERCMPQIMSQCDCLHQIFVQSQRFRDCSCILRYFQCMCKSCPVMIPLRIKKDLRLLF